MFKIVKRYYERKIYGNAEVAKFVQAGQLTAEEYLEITGEMYASASAAEE